MKFICMLAFCLSAPSLVWASFSAKSPELSISIQSNIADGQLSTSSSINPIPLASPDAQSENLHSKQTVVLGIQGNISKNLVATVKQAVDKVSGDPIPAGFIVLLDSSGGDGIAAMKIGRMLRSAHAQIFVTGQCASACIFVLSSGVVRSAPAYSIGIHRGRVTISDRNAKVLQEVDVNSNPAAKKMLEKFEQEVPEYFTEMGMPPDLFQAMQSHQYRGVYRLSSEENTFYGLTGFDPAYLAERAALFEKINGPYHMNKDELHRRTLKVASHCANFDKQHVAFIDCYKKVLKDPYLN